MKRNFEVGRPHLLALLVSLVCLYLLVLLDLIEDVGRPASCNLTISPARRLSLDGLWICCCHAFSSVLVHAQLK
jgi:hypothetical protein